MDTKLNKSDWTLIIILYSVTIVINSIDYYKDGNMLKEYIVDFSVSIVMSLSAVLFFMYWLIPNYLVHKQKYIHFVFFGLLSLFIGGYIDKVASFWSGENDWSKFPKGIDLFLHSVFRLLDNIGLILGVLLTKKFYQGKTELINIEKKQKENELKLLRSQIEPHFLFNNLNTLDSLIDSDSEKAKEYINRLSLIYRYLIQTKDAEVMELSKELKFAENYIFLIETRFGNDYKFNIEKKVTVSNKFIPTGALQTLLENVVKHNKANKEPIETNINITEGWLTVKNTKTNTPNKESLGTGLENLQTRYELLSDKKIAIGNNTNKFIVSIPIIKLSDEN
ncbi:histidine kinase [uncultured Tenacibaculum sp.]|uniref:sensor histidine kinase n=1 Tax=uncultured Tenacibaculum sp. TaxID=174713 RepID=UPI00261FC6F1|nr:histidine kinase [uncultured Tenacibaculum sp.]